MIATFDYEGAEVSLGIHSGILPFESSLAINTYIQLKTLKKGDLITLRGIAVAHGGPQILAIDENAIKRFTNSIIKPIKL
ncbi:MAG: hypothetical protein IJU60_03180 [Acholeplasmatales bacterium]|nr:hypothetical protein [Acholeplasmatales bacterium]